MASRRFKRALKALALLAALAVGGLALVIFYRGELLRLFALHRIESQTGLRARLDKVEIGFGQPLFRLENFILTNAPGFGGSPMLRIPELHVEFDPDALARQELRLPLVRFSLEELHIVRDQEGRTNVMELFRQLEPLSERRGSSRGGTNALGYEYKGIDQLVLSVGRLRFTDLGNPRRNQSIELAVTNHIARNIQTEEQFQAALLTLLLKAGARNLFFAPSGTNNSPGGRFPLDLLFSR